MKRCPNHGLNPTHQVLAFCKGCLPDAKSELNRSAGGSLIKIGEAAAMEVIERVASNDGTWTNERSKVHRIASATEVSPDSSLANQLELIHRKLDLMGVGSSVQDNLEGVEDVNYIHQGGNRYYNNSRPNEGGGGFNHFGNKPHPNLSYGNPNNALQPPPGFTVSQGMITEPQKRGLEDVLNAFMTQSQKNMEHSNKRLEKVENDVHSMATHMKNLEVQMSQIAQSVSGQHKPGQFPGQPTINPKDCKAIHLRSGTSYEGPSMPETPPKPVAEPEKEADVEVEKEELETSSPPVKPTEVKVPFPQMLQRKKKNDQFAKFWEIFKKVQINIPLIEALQQMPGYVKFLKEAVAKKKKWGHHETVNLTENCSAILQMKLPAKMQDPGSFTIECTIGDHFVKNALCDLGASINLMPLSLYKKMKIGPLKPTSITLQMADRSVSYPVGIVEDILVRVNEFVFPADFVILDMEEDRKIPLILGRPFLATGKALIDVDNGELTFRFNGESTTFSIYEALKRHDVEPGGSLQHCNVVTTVDEYVFLGEEGDTYQMW